MDRWASGESTRSKRWGFSQWGRLVRGQLAPGPQSLAVRLEARKQEQIQESEQEKGNPYPEWPTGSGSCQRPVTTGMPRDLCCSHKYLITWHRFRTQVGKTSAKWTQSQPSSETQKAQPRNPYMSWVMLGTRAWFPMEPSASGMHSPNRAGSPRSGYLR